MADANQAWQDATVTFESLTVKALRVQIASALAIHTAERYSEHADGTVDYVCSVCLVDETDGDVYEHIGVVPWPCPTAKALSPFDYAASPAVAPDPALGRCQVLIQCHRETGHEGGHEAREEASDG